MGLIEVLVVLLVVGSIILGVVAATQHSRIQMNKRAVGGLLEAVQELYELAGQELELSEEIMDTLH